MNLYVSSFCCKLFLLHRHHYISKLSYFCLSGAKARIKNNAHLNRDEQKVVIAGRKKVVAELGSKSRSKSKSKKHAKKWKEESEQFREVMRTNRLISKAEKEGKRADYYL